MAIPVRWLRPLQLGECGLDEYEKRGWVGWYHPTVLSLLALTFLVLPRRRLGGNTPA